MENRERGADGDRSKCNLNSPSEKEGKKFKLWKLCPLPPVFQQFQSILPSDWESQWNCPTAKLLNKMMDKYGLRMRNLSGGARQTKSGEGRRNWKTEMLWICMKGKCRALRLTALCCCWVTCKPRSIAWALSLPTRSYMTSVIFDTTRGEIDEKTLHCSSADHISLAQWTKCVRIIVYSEAFACSSSFPTGLLKYSPEVIISFYICLRRATEIITLGG